MPQEPQLPNQVSTNDLHNHLENYRVRSNKFHPSYRKGKKAMKAGTIRDQSWTSWCGEATDTDRKLETFRWYPQQALKLWWQHIYLNAYSTKTKRNWKLKYWSDEFRILMTWSTNRLSTSWESCKLTTMDKYRHHQKHGKAVRVIYRLKNHKSPGDNGIIVGVLKYGPTTLSGSSPYRHDLRQWINECRVATRHYLSCT